MTSRNRRKNRPPQMSEALWVGYVEDEESVEMIMKKFEVLQKMQEKPTATEAIQDTDIPATEESKQEDEGLNQHQLENLFKETSTFSLSMLAQENQYHDDEDDFNFSENEDDYFGDEESFFREDDFDGEGPTVKKRRIKGGVVERSAMVKSRFVEVTSEEGFVFTVKKKIKHIDPLLPCFTRIPPLPIPFSWAKTIKPFDDTEVTLPGSKYIETDILKFDFKSLKSTNFQALLIDPPWKLAGDDRQGLVTPQILHEKLNFVSIIPRGFVFLWIEKEIQPQAVKWMKKLEFTYAENLVWVQQEPNNQVVKGDYKYFRKSKKSLLIFKKGEGLELRHQRNPDVVFDFVRKDKHLTEDKPEFIYHVIETLLPTAKYDEASGSKMIEVWAKKGQKRTGWITVAQKV